LYGSHEFNLLAWECPRRGLYHVCGEAVLLEVLRQGRPAGPGEEGEVVATALHSFAMPFVRYRLGDVVVQGPPRCECGWEGAVLQRIAGRVIDYFPLPCGGRLHPYVLVGPLVAEATWVQRFKLVQEALGRIRLRVLPERAPGGAEVERLRARLQGLLPPGVEVVVEVTADLPGGKTGKYLPYESLVKAAHARSALE
ncbi:MAG: hypothetical protein ACREMY_12640, partial [bacterium]